MKTSMDPPKKPPDPLDPPAPAWQDEGLEFEITDFEDARRVLDNESISQFDVANAASPEHWKRVRRGTLPTDRALSGQGIDWLLSLSPDLRPERLGEQFPRIVNELAAVWHDAEQRRAAIDRLLGGERKGRKGFTPAVHAELVALRDWMIALRDWDEPFLEHR